MRVSTRVCRFNPRSRKGNDFVIPMYLGANGIVSIHVPARGTTQLQQLRQHLVNSFNPRSRKGNDSDSCRRTASVSVSIHVPARGTTMTAGCRSGARLFQSTFPQGERPRDWSAKGRDRWFQSTFPQGERHKGVSDVRFDYRFNPRSRKGNDLSIVLLAM